MSIGIKNINILKQIMEFASEGMCLYDCVGEVVTANSMFLKIFGLDSDSSDCHKKIEDIVHKYTEKTQLYNQKNSISEQVELLEKADGAKVSLIIKAGSFENDEGYYILLTVAEISDSPSAMKEISAKVIKAVEDERVRIARYLHDDVAQLLIIANNKLISLENTLECGVQLIDISKDIDTSIEKIRRLMFEFNLVPDLNLSLAEAIQELFDEIIAKENIDSSIIDDGEDKPIDNDSKIIIIQAIKELLFNVIKHSGATRVDVTIERDNDFVRVIVEDNGKGFAYENKKPTKNGGFGLVNIFNSFRAIGGRVEVIPRAGGGSRVELYVHSIQTVNIKE